MKRKSRGRATSVHRTMKYHKVETKETQTEQSKEGEIVDPIQRIFDHLNIFPCDLDRMVFEYWPGIHSPEKIWNIFEDFCDKRFTNLLLEFQKGELESDSSSQIMRSFLDSLQQIFEKKFADILPKHDSSHLLIHFAKDLFNETIDRKMTSKLYTNWHVPGSTLAWTKGDYNWNGSLPSFLTNKRPLIDTNPSTILLYYFLIRGFSC